MAVIIRTATNDDAPQWLELLKVALGTDYVAKQVYDPDWVSAQLNALRGEETWVAVVDGRLRGSITVLLPFTPNTNPVCNVGRHLSLPGNYQDGTAEALLRKITNVCAERRQLAILRVLASDHPQQILLEKLGFVCVGFQPLKHLYHVREGVLFYVRVASPDSVVRLPYSQALPQINELAAMVLANLKIPSPEMVRDGATGYPLQTELQISEATVTDYESCRASVQALNSTVEVSGQFNRGLGIFRVVCNTPMRYILARREGRFVAGLSYYFDDHDLCVRLVESFSLDDLSPGAMVQHAAGIAREQLKALYVEVDILMTAPRLLKSAEQLGFVPVAYLPGFYDRGGGCSDLVKMVKLNVPYSMDRTEFTPHAKALVQIVDRNFEDQKLGVAIIKLLGGLPFFRGLGDGELCKIARLFTQKLFHPNEKVFNRGDAGNEAYVVMRGQIDICLEENAKPVASLGNGAIFGEQAFLANAPRSAVAVARQPTILLVIHRPAFNALIQNEPHLGMVVMRNIALELSQKLRHANTALSAAAK